jgi:hypothetical protein
MTTRNILITGATDGIGLALARHYQHQEPAARLVLIGRRPLPELDPQLFRPQTYCPVDLAQPTCATQLLLWLHENKIGHLNLVFHNAALGFVGPPAGQSAEKIRDLIAVNLRAPVALTHALLPLVAVNGRIVFLSSVAVALPTPTYAVYTATKVALEGFARNLRTELTVSHPTVQIQIIRPGATRTGMHRKSGATFDTTRFAAAEHVAAQIARAATHPQPEVTLGLNNRWLYLAGRRLARPLDALLTAQAAWRQGHAARPARRAGAVTPPHCVITGAADGIGRALALAFAAAGYQITGIDVDPARSAATTTALKAQGAQVTFLHADLTDDAALTQTVAALLAGPPITILVHNAGINAVGAFANSDLAQQQRVLDLNLQAPLLLTAALLDAGHLTTTGALVFLASLSHFVGYPGAAVYAASKDGLAAYARSLRIALAPQTVLTVFPGPTRTAHARRYSPDNRREGRRMPPDVLAAQIVQAVQQGRSWLIPGWGNRVAAVVGVVAPRLMEQIMRRAILDRLPVTK